jgi:hypothetical protein
MVRVSRPASYLQFCCEILICSIACCPSPRRHVTSRSGETPQLHGRRSQKSWKNLFLACHLVDLLRYNGAETNCSLLDRLAPNDLYNTLLKCGHYVAEHSGSWDLVLDMLNLQVLLIKMDFSKVGCKDWRCIAMAWVRVHLWALVSSALKFRIVLAL